MSLLPLRRRGLVERWWIRWKWSRRSIARRLPQWARRALPWGTSVFLHAVVLFVIALIIQIFAAEPEPRDVFGNDLAGQLRDDVTSLQVDDHAGDPFTALESPVPPSLPVPLAAVERTFNLPELPSQVQLRPEPALSPGDVTPSKPRRAPTDSGGTGTTKAAVAAPFSGRQGAAKARLVRSEGGTKESEAAVERGLDWIARHQRPDGAWSLDTNDMCTAPGCPPCLSMRSDTGATGLALLPLLGAGHLHTEPGRYQTTLARGLKWLINAQQPDGAIFTGGGTHTAMYSHAIATMALCEAYALTHDPRLRSPAQRAVNFLIRAQHPLGGWRYVPQMEGDTSVLGWVMFALRSANLGGLSVSKKALGKSARYLDLAAADRLKSIYAYKAGMPMTFSMTAEALVCRQLLGWPRESPALLQGSALIARHLNESTERNIYYWYYATQLLHNMHDKNWEVWNAKIREELVATQIRGVECDRGSWDPTSPATDLWGSKGGRLFQTSLSLLTLEVYYRYLPLYRDRGGAIVGSDDAGLAEAEEPKAIVGDGKPAAKPEDSDED